MSVPDAIETDLRAIEAGYPKESQRLREELRQLYARGKLVDLVERGTEVTTLVAERLGVVDRRLAIVDRALERLTEADAMRARAEADAAEAARLDAQRKLEADQRTAERWMLAGKAFLTSGPVKAAIAGLTLIITAVATYVATQWGVTP